MFRVQYVRAVWAPCARRLFIWRTRICTCGCESQLCRQLRLVERCLSAIGAGACGGLGHHRASRHLHCARAACVQDASGILGAIVQPSGGSSCSVPGTAPAHSCDRVIYLGGRSRLYLASLLCALSLTSTPRTDSACNMRRILGAGVAVPYPPKPGCPLPPALPALCRFSACPICWPLPSPRGPSHCIKL